MGVFNSICVKVERPAKIAGASPLRLFMQTFEVDSSLNIPYQSIIEIMHLLYGSDVIVSFSSELITYKNK